MGAFGASTGSLEASQTHRLKVDMGVIQLLDEAAVHAAGIGRAMVTVGDVLLQLGAYGFEEGLNTRRSLALRTVAYSWALLLAARELTHRKPASTDVAITPEVMELVRNAARTALDAHHQVIHTDHLLVAALAAPGARILAARLLTGWDARQPEVVKEMIADTQQDLQRTSKPPVHALSPATVSLLYEASDATEPKGNGAEDQG
jgi:ATP-dependent Clp protease ATP-binding subunit ClpA